MGAILGWINIILIVSMAAIYPIKLAAIKDKDKKLLPLYKRVRKIHPIIGIIIITIGFIHGYIQLGTIRMHSGAYILITLIFMAGLSVIGPRIKKLKKNWRIIHRYMIIVLLFFILNHIFKII